MRILFTAGPSYGHINPLLPMASAAQRAGHDVVVATGAELVAHVRHHGLVVWRVGRSRGEQDARFRAANPDLDRLGFEQRVARMVDGLFVDAAAARIPDLLARIEDWPPDLVIFEPCELAGAIIAARSRARLVVHGISAPVPLPIWAAAFGPGFTQLCAAWGLPRLAEDVLDAEYLDIWPRALAADAPPAWPRVRRVRPAGGPAAPGEALPWDERRLAALPHPRTAHLSLGTIFSDAPGVLETAVAGLRELPVNVVVTVGPQGDPARLGAQPAHVLVDRYVPHELLLRRCDLLVDHAGAGILLAGLSHGLPQLLLPQGLDQFDNAAAAQRVGTALTLTSEQLTADAVAAQALRLLTEPAFRSAARNVAAEIAAMPRPHQAFTALLQDSP